MAGWTLNFLRFLKDPLRERRLPVVDNILETVEPCSWQPAELYGVRSRDEQ